MRDVLADGKWHPVDQVINAGRRHVPPATAMAAYRLNIARYHKHTAPWRIKAIDVAQQRRDGAWDLCRRIVTHWRSRGIVEIQGEAKTKQVRLLRP